MIILRLTTVLIFVCSCIFSHSSLADASDAGEERFFPLTFAFVCNDKTSAVDRYEVARSAQALGDVHPTECVDKRKLASNVRPVAVSWVHNKAADLYMVIIRMNAQDAAAIAQLTASVTNQKMIIYGGDRAILSSRLYSPFHGDKFYISADSLEDARHTVSVFSERGGL
ncbi:hypothetical protein [Dyella tabacisoli]|uniref:hypothetical protein n=1 Tax=Dyella tabacisoli TaxID=2282381 RepID=UPI0013B40F26|nr:hypothetical protein [Dyella tabacisoli]